MIFMSETPSLAGLALLEKSLLFEMRNPYAV
jgi:hypothetical protein